MKDKEKLMQRQKDFVMYLKNCMDEYTPEKNFMEMEIVGVCAGLLADVCRQIYLEKDAFFNLMVCISNTIYDGDNHDA